MRIVGSLLVALVAITTMSRAAHATELVIGVISPIGDGREIGREHDATIAFALGEVGVISGGGVTVPLRIERTSDGGDAERAVELARELKSRGAVAILGPVDSKSAKAVLEARLDIPVLSATATAAELHDPWFFRMTLSDRERIRQYASTLRNQNLAPERRIVVFDDSNPYGSGLEEEISRELGIPQEFTIGWSELVGSGGVSNANRDRVRRGQGFSERGLEMLNPMPATIIVLGSSLNAVPVAQGIDAVFRERGEDEEKRRFLFVGDDPILRDGAPRGSITVGEPTILEKEDAGLASVQSRYKERTQLDGETIVITAYEAARFVLPRALEEVVREVGGRSVGESHALAPEVVRAALRDKLSSLKFASLEPWREISLKDGEIEGAPPVPVYSINRSLHELDVPVRPPYLKMPRQVLKVGFLQGPVTIKMLARGRLDRDPEVRFYRNGGNPVLATPASISVKGDEVEVSFYPWIFGTYHLDATPVRMSPPQPEIEVKLDFAYPLALVGAVLGSLLFVLAVTEKGGPFPRRRFVLGIFTGLLIAVANFYRAAIPPEWPITLPSFGGALFDGLVGGWVGPGILLVLMTRVWPGSGAGSPKTQEPGSKQDAKPDIAPVGGAVEQS